MYRGSRGSSASTLRRSLMAVFSTESLTKRWPQTSSSKRVLGQERTRVADERAQQPEGCRRQIDRSPAAQQQRVGLVELELAEANAQRAGVSGGSWVRTLHRTLMALATIWALDCEASSAASS